MNLRETGKGWDRLLRPVLAVLGTYGICYIGGLAGIQKGAFSVLTVPGVIAVYFLLSRTQNSLSEIKDEKKKIKRRKYAAAVSLLFSAAMVIGYQLQANGMTESGVRGKGLILFRAFCLSIVIFPFGNLFFQGVEKAGSAPVPAGRGRPWKRGTLFAVCGTAVFLSLLPVWLAYYPIIMSYDFHRQINEAAKGFQWFWPYQPLAHTWIIWLFLQVGELLGNIQTGMACMALFQMLLYSLAAAYACVFLYRVTNRKGIVGGALLFFGLFPLNSVMVMCTTKDVLFGILFLVFVLLLAERSFFASSRGRHRLIQDILLVCTGCILSQLRNNCLYAVVVFGTAWVIFSPKGERLRVLLLCGLLAVGGKAAGAGIKAALGTQLGPAKVEMYSVPIQQMARVGFYHGEELEEETWEILNTYISEEYWQRYNPPIADTVKAMVGVSTFPTAWEGHEAQLLGDWLRLGLRYPNEYLDAFLELTRGYWFPDDRSHAECLGYGREGRMGIIYTYNSSELSDGREIAHQSKFPWLEEKLEAVVSENVYYQWPVVSVLFRCSFYVWGLFLVFLAFLFLNRKKAAVICLFPLIYMGTMLLGPVVQMRYVFPVMLVLPVLAGLLLLRET